MNLQLQKDLDYIYSRFNNKKIFENKNVLITGCNGFIGFELSNFLIKFFKKLKLKNLYLTDLKIKAKKISYINAYFKKFDVIKEKISIKKFGKIDIIIHAASIASPVLYRKDPLKTIDANVTGLRMLLEYSKKNKISRLLYFSSSEIYGNPDQKNIPTKESYNGNVACVGPRACYDEAKRISETLCYVYNKKYKVPARVVRPFNNYGPGMKITDKRLPADIAKSIINNKNIILYSNGSPTRTFCYIADAIVGYLAAMSYKKYDVFNIGKDDEEVSVKKFALEFIKSGKKIIKYNKKIHYKVNKDKDYLKDNPKRRKPDLTKAKKILKYTPKISLKEGVTRYIKFLKND